MPSSSSPSKEEVIDVEDTSCTLCFAPSSDFSVTRYPPKPVKKKSREEEHLLCIVESAGKFLVVQRPSTGLLASLWQFPMLESGELDMEAMSAVLREHAGDLELPEFKELGTVKHVFSHLVWNLRVFACIVSDEVSERECKEGVRWLDEKGLEEAALPTGMRKAFGLRKPAKGKKRKGNQSDGENEPVKAPTKRGKKEKVEKEGKQQKDIKSFFTKAAAN